MTLWQQRPVALVGLVLAVVMACSSPTRDLPAAGIAEISQRIDELAMDLVDSDAPGLAVLVLRKGELAHSRGYGLADLEARTRIRPSTTFHFASCGKQMTGVAIMLLAEAGKLDYDDAVSQYIPELASLGRGVTIRRLLLHTAALPDLYEELAELEEVPSNDVLLELLAERGVVGTPGHAESYSNEGYDVLGSVVERVSGQPFERFMRDRIFDPVGMTRTFSLPDAEGLADKNRAIGYTALEGAFEVLESDPLDNVRGSGSVYTSIGDMSLYDRALDSADLLPRGALAEAFRPGRLNDGEEVPYGFGWLLGEHRGRNFAAHAGEWLGYASYYLRYPKDRLSVVVLANRDDLDVEELAFSIGDLY